MLQAVETLGILSEWESLKCLMMYFSSDITMKHVVEFGSKDRNGNKKRAFEEFRFPSDKYNNYDHLISASMKFKSYLSIEYPNPNKEDKMKSHILNLYSYSIEGLFDAMNRFESTYIEAFASDKNKELILKTPKINNVYSQVTPYSKIEFEQDIYLDRDNNKDLGVRIGLNEEYYFTIRYSTTWKEFKYYIRMCDLYGWGISSISSYMNSLPGMAVCDLSSGNYVSSNRYAPLNEDPDDIANNANSVKVGRVKPVTREERKKSFFDD